MRRTTFYILLLAAAGLFGCTSEFATQDEIDRCVEIVGVEESGFTLKQTVKPNGVDVVIQQSRNLSAAEKAAIEECIEARLNARIQGQSIPIDNLAIDPEAEPGKLPLPVQYPLLPEDIAIWNSLTLKQQERAIAFLARGSTVSASLKED
ncbi:MAG: hypothetical protein AAF198_06020 [Pseudomonadota bacterium]